MSTKRRPAPALPAALTGPATPGEVAKSVTDANGTPAVRPFENIGGSKSESFTSVLLRETLATICAPGNDDDGTNKAIQAAAAALAAFKPKDEIEGMIAAQAVALHFGAMEALRRSMLKDQPSEIATRLRKDGANLARAMTDMLSALDRKRGKRPQVVRVERVVVQDGGQAIVGNVNPDPKAAGGVGFERKPDEEPHGGSMRCAQQGRQPVRQQTSAERPMPLSWGAEHRASHRRRDRAN